MRNLLTVIVLVVAVGCGSSQPPMKSAPVSITGKVSQGGKPIGNVAVTFQPLDVGHMKSLPVKPDGTFQGDLIPGTYAYAIAQSSAPESGLALAKIAPQYLEPDLARTVQIESGQELQIALD